MREIFPGSDLAHLDALTEKAEIIFDPGRDGGLVEVYSGSDGGSGGQFLQGGRRSKAGRFQLAAALQYSVVNVGVVPHEGGFEVVVVAVSVDSLQGLNKEKYSW